MRKVAGTLSLPKATASLSNVGSARGKKMLTRVGFLGKEIVNSKTVIAQGKLFASQ